MKINNIKEKLIFVVIVISVFVVFLVVNLNDNIEDEVGDISDNKVINIYKDSNNNIGITSDYGEYQGKITCNSNNCEYIAVYKNYIIIEDNNKYYLYNYIKSKLVFGPFNFASDEYYNCILSNNNNLIGIYYKNKNDYKFYVVDSNKHFSTIKGTLWSNEMNYDYSLLSDYGYFVIDDDKNSNFINLKTGKIVFSIPNMVYSIFEDIDNKRLYFSSFSKENNKYTIYDNNGNILFNGDYVDNFKFDNNKLFLSYDKYVKIYDNDYNLIHTSRNYDEIKEIFGEYIVVIDNGYLKIIDSSDNILATFNEKWDEKKYEFHETISGWHNDNSKNSRIYLVIENKDIPYGNIGSGIEFYYDPVTKEVGIIETEGVGGYEKPIVYLYPTQKTDISLTFANPSLITTSYPKFDKKWQVTAYPNGDLYDLNGKYYYGLYWEEESNHLTNFSTGFYVLKKDAINFLEEKLSIIGLNDREKNEFIMYWLPVLEKNNRSLVYFELTEERNRYNKLIINPKPDSLLRISIHIKKVNEKVFIKEQNLSTFKRNGFTVIEWGGIIH